MKALVIGDHYVAASVIADSLEETLRKIQIPLEVKTIDLDFPFKIRLPSREKKLTIYDIQGDPEDIIPYMGDVEILVAHFADINAQVINAGKKLKVIGVPRGGPVNIDIEAATKRGIPVLNAPGRSSVAVADFTIGLLLAEARNIARAHASLTAGKWRFDFHMKNLLGPELPGKILGLVGFGAIGKLVAKRAKGFDLKVYIYDPYISKEEANALGVKKVDLDTLLRESDFISVHARLTKETVGLIGAEEFEKMKSTAVFINTSRGEVVDEIALYNALRNRKIAGAALDVFIEEPLVYSPLLHLDNITFTPHLGGATREIASTSAHMISEEVANFLSGKPCKNIVNPQVIKN